MKCINCGHELTDDAAFCENCGTPVGGERTTIINDPDTQYEQMSFKPNEPPARIAEEPRSDTERSQSAPVQYGETAQNVPATPPQYIGEDRFRPGTRPAQMNYAPAPAAVQKPPKDQKKKTRKALWISLVALLLVIAILSGVIIFISKNFVSAAELKEAKEGYRPPAEIVQIDTTLKDPSNDNIKFRFDERDRIIGCSYTINKKQYDKAYTYDDIARAVEIVTTYRRKNITETSIAYEDIRPDEGAAVAEVSGEFVSPPEQSGNAASQAEPAQKMTEAPTEEPLGEIESVNLTSDEALTSFLLAYAINTFWTDAKAEFDCRRPTDNGQNILASIVRDPTCVNIHPNHNMYPGTGRSLTPSTPVDCPWSTGGKNAYSFDKAEVDWIIENIFNIPASQIDLMYDTAYQAQKLWKSDTAYYALERDPGNLGSVYNAEVTEAKSDGKYTYIKFNVNFLGQSSPYYAVMGKKTIDGTEYWSMYYCSATIPSEIEHFDIHG